jgi:hypothetical protein
MTAPIISCSQGGNTVAVSLPEACCLIGFAYTLGMTFWPEVVAESNRSTAGFEKAHLGRIRENISASLKGTHFRRFWGGPDRAAASSEHTHTLAVA